MLCSLGMAFTEEGHTFHGKTTSMNGWASCCVILLHTADDRGQWAAKNTEVSVA